MGVAENGREIRPDDVCYVLRHRRASFSGAAHNKKLARS